MLQSNKSLSPQKLSTFDIELEGDSLINEALVSPSTRLTLESTSARGYLYSIQFETNYDENYTQAELENIKNDHNLHLYISTKEKKYFIQPDGTAFGFVNAEKKMVIIQQIDRDLNTIVNSEKVSKLSSNAYAYIKAQPVEFKNIVSNNQIALDHFLNKFEKSKENGLEEYIMAAACVEILGEKNPVKEWESGRVWYEQYIAANNK